MRRTWKPRKSHLSEAADTGISARPIPYNRDTHVLLPSRAVSGRLLFVRTGNGPRLVPAEMRELPSWQIQRLNWTDRNLSKPRPLHSVLAGDGHARLHGVHGTMFIMPSEFVQRHRGRKLHNVPRGYGHAWQLRVDSMYSMRSGYVQPWRGARKLPSVSGR